MVLVLKKELGRANWIKIRRIWQLEENMHLELIHKITLALMQMQ